MLYILRGEGQYTDGVNDWKTDVCCVRRGKLAVNMKTFEGNSELEDNKCEKGVCCVYRTMEERMKWGLMIGRKNIAACEERITLET